MESVTASLLRSGLSYDTIIQFGVRIMIIFLVVPIHEYAHAWSAVKLGDDTPRYQGRLTLNPVAHIDIIGAICLLFAGFGWGKPVQINPRNFREYRKGNALCAAAGPLSNLIVGTGGMIIYKIFWYAYISSLSQTLYWLAFIMYYFTVVNLGLAVFNLIPIPPLDGSKIVSYFAGNKWDGFMYRYQRQISIVFMLLIISGVLDTPLGYIQNGMFWLIDKITFFVDLIGKALV
ncbi:MAG: site-2 protease family protein [Ruminococcus sp.]|nr:site-2 protease family protein [Ruminococcus sp.]